ncbi:hypothetical protein NIES2119_21470 [[Phormidium ambiguum] IAM M-71]|uniref:PEP-CTERM protein-sorting domain-containing protein n=1 Tax=[Phormidium ambiguum] IAM M-71 TaxID=454136 RepID=A0A1U7IBQ5_9CYAN|nr:choice-of-anchor E domain-containing protein [Phormidium ambiguum]OKH34074.1 hypothetical protein NIES2119_21470 [Phormidium ambiguum IAM M-71]
MKAKFLNTVTKASITTASTFTSILLGTAIANAATITYTAAYQQTPEDIEFGAPTGYGFTDIVDSILSIQQFDSSLGTLNSVFIEFTGNMRGDAEFESRDARPQTITVDLSGLLTLVGPNNNPVFELKPQEIRQYDVTRFDGTVDFGGTSGRTITGISAEASTSETIADLSALTPFIGNGTVDFSFSANAESSVRGSGNILSGISTFAKADIKVIYDYTEVPKKVPESSMVLGLGLIAGFGLLSQRKNVFNRF